MKSEFSSICFLALIMVGCAPFDWPVLTLGSPGGYTKNLKIVPPVDICDADGYIDGYRSGYMRTWNQEMEKQIEINRRALQDNPNDEETATRYSANKSKLFDLQSANQKETRYQFGVISTECEFHSFTLGQSRGSKDALHDISAPAAPTPKSSGLPPS